MSAVSFSKIGSKAGDLAGDDVFDVGLFAFEVKSTSKSGVTFTSSGTKKNNIGSALNDEEFAKKADQTASLSGKFADKERGLTYNESWALDGKITSKLTIEPSQVKGLTIGLSGDYKENDDNTSKKSAKVTVDLANANFNAGLTVAIDPDFKAPTAGADGKVPKAKGGHEVSAAVGVPLPHNLVVGVSGSYNASTSTVGNTKARVGYSTSDAQATIFAENLQDFAKAKAGFSYWNKVSAQTNVAGSVTLDRKEGKVPTFAVGISHAYDDSNDWTFGLTVCNNNAIGGVAYETKLQKDLTLALTTKVYASELLANKDAVQMGFKLSYSV